MEFKIITAEEWLEMFPKNGILEGTKINFLKTVKTVRIVRLKDTIKFRPVYEGPGSSSFYLRGNKRVYIK